MAPKRTVEKVSRRIPPAQKLLLAVAAGGRCEFCNKFLFEHPITMRGLNLSEHAHIFPFSRRGPRSEERGRPNDIHAIENLVLLCGDCHKEIDKNKSAYPVAAVAKMKKEHEERIHHLTSLRKEAGTSLLVFKGLIADRPVDIPFEEMRDAVAPKYPADRKGFMIDVTTNGKDLDDEYFKGAERMIRTKMEEFYQRNVDDPAPRHVSVFALASIPLLVLFGRCVSDKVSVEFYQRHHDMKEQPWRWQDVPTRLAFTSERIKEGSETRRIGLMVSISGKVEQASIPREVWDSCPIFEIRVSSELPDRRVLRTRDDLAEFRRVYGSVLASIGRDYPECEELHLFLAAPAPAVVTCGHERLPKIQPALHVYDNIKNNETGRNMFVPRLRIT